MMRARIRIVAICAVFFVAAAGLSGTAFAVPPADWSGIPTKTVTLFYPGESTYDWLISPPHRKGDRQVRRGKSCLSCHEDDEADMGNLVVRGGDLEPTPIPGKNGTIELAVQAAHDSEFLYFRFQWKSNADREGRMHNYIRFDGENWKFATGRPSSTSSAQETKRRSRSRRHSDIGLLLSMHPRCHRDAS